MASDSKLFKNQYLNEIHKEIYSIKTNQKIQREYREQWLYLEKCLQEINNEIKIKFQKQKAIRKTIKISRQEEKEIQEIINNRYNDRTGLLNLNQKRQRWDRVIYYMARYYSQGLKQIKLLNLQQCNISNANIQELTKHDWFQLENLWLWGNQLDDFCANKIFQNKLWPSLKMLRLAHNKITGKGLLQFFGPNFPSLDTFYFARNRSMNIEGIKRVFQQATQKLKILQLSDCILESKGVKLLIKSEFPNLEQLKVEKCGIGSDGAKYLVKGFWPSLKKLSLNGNFLRGLPTIHLSINGWKNQFQKLNERQRSKHIQPIACLELVATPWIEAQVIFETDSYSLKSEVQQILQSRFQFY